MKEMYENLKNKLNINYFEAGVLVGVLIAAYAVNKDRARNRRDISRVLENTVLKVRAVE